MIPLTGSADDGKRSALYVLVDRGYEGDSSIQSFGLATPGRGRRDDGKRSALYVVVDRGYQGDTSIQSSGLAPTGRGRQSRIYFFWAQKSDLVT